MVYEVAVGSEDLFYFILARYASDARSIMAVTGAKALQLVLYAFWLVTLKHHDS